jgi:hypothetical protein
MSNQDDDDYHDYELLLLVEFEVLKLSVGVIRDEYQGVLEIFYQDVIKLV